MLDDEMLFWHLCPQEEGKGHLGFFHMSTCIDGEGSDGSCMRHHNLIIPSPALTDKTKRYYMIVILHQGSCAVDLHTWLYHMENGFIYRTSFNLFISYL